MQSPMVRAVLRELLAKLTRLAANGQSDSIDLHRLPLPPGGIDALKSWLGDGEIAATVTALGLTTIRETAVAGVWWVQNAKAAGDAVSEHLEISYTPALLATHPDDLKQAVETLRDRLSATDLPAPHVT